jgi:hypothetical protein
MQHLLQRMSVFLRHVIEAPESSEETRETAKELEADVDDAINGNYREDDDSDND